MSPWWFLLSYYFREQAGQKRGGRSLFIVWLASTTRIVVFKFQESRSKMNYLQSKPTISKQELRFLRRSLTRLFSFPKSVSFPMLLKHQKYSSCGGHHQAILERRDKWHLSHSQITKEEAQKRLYSWRRMTRSRTSFL